MSSSHVSAGAWAITLGSLTFVLLIDFLLAFRNRHKETTLRSVSIWTVFYVLSAVLFGISMGFWLSEQARSEFFAGWLTEYSLSFDNLFVFILIMARLKVEKNKEEMVLFYGIVSSLFLRGIFISAGSVVINRFEWIFYFFGLFLIYTAFSLLKESEEEEWTEGKATRWLQKKGASVFVIALSAIAITNVLFAFDSIPAIFGLTRNPYVIVTANVFALMGLRQLYFLIGSLMHKLVYLTQGLSVILGFIGIKLIFEAAISQKHHKVIGINIPAISLGLSLGFIIAVLCLTTLLSLLKSRKSA